MLNRSLLHALQPGSQSIMSASFSRKNTPSNRRNLPSNNITENRSVIMSEFIAKAVQILKQSNIQGLTNLEFDGKKFKWLNDLAELTNSFKIVLK